MKITKIEIQKKNKNRVNLYLDEEFYCGLSLETIMKNHLKEGFEINENQIEFLKTETEREVALSKAVGYISKCQKTKKEILKYLLSKGEDFNLYEYILVDTDQEEMIEEYDLKSANVKSFLYSFIVSGSFPRNQSFV